MKTNSSAPPVAKPVGLVVLAYFISYLGMSLSNNTVAWISLIGVAAIAIALVVMAVREKGVHLWAGAIIAAVSPLMWVAWYAPQFSA
ncbi:hypothetical protein KRX51_08065 [Corynebacterium sp. TAE3-ERU12]|uniref:hypothetical protein n=1 Tax=Corynebacterium sp. TAE3-ERU12 TaxID=2849491 RepID=UPI001C48E205|nr:hypothetical protein [Corynebacterium sp. TAE3-ERU12]MBV7295862.1 hypothetical protein [Corynebacterium sp. TAE3-ERU12]